MNAHSRVIVLIAWLLLFTGAAAGVELNRQLDFNVAAQELSSGVLEFSKQADIALLAEGQKIEGVRTAGVRGRHTIGDALRLLLEGTGFAYKVVGSNTISLVVGTERGAPSAIQLEGIVVTAQKRDERAFDVPISIVAMGADELQKRKITSLDDLSSAVPGLAIQSTGGVQRRIMLRGISNVFGNSSLIGLYLDEASVTSGPTSQLDLRTYDLERIEVLRGPQGTLYGEGSVGGTIRFITKDPLLDRPAMDADVAALFTQDGAPSQRIETVLNVPLIENELGLRIASTFDRQGGWIDQPAVNRKNINDQNLVNVRIKGLWQPSPQFTVNAMAVIHRNNAAPNMGEDAHGNFTQTFNLTTTPSVKDEYDLYNLTLTYDFGAVRFLSTTSYFNQDKESRDLGVRAQVTPPGTTPPFDILQFVQAVASNVFSEELRLTSIGSGPWQWTAGGFYREAQFDFAIPSISVGLPGPPGTPVPDPFSVGPNRTLSRSWAIFGDTSYKLTDRLTLGTGIRYFEDKQEFTSGSGPTAAIQTGTFDALNPRVYAQYKLTPQVNTYASAAKGFRSGGFNSLNQPPYDPESVWTYELGTKVSLLEGRLGADVAVYYSDYKNHQIAGVVVLPSGETPNITSNAGNARIKGIEWGLTWRPENQWTLSFNGNYGHSRFYEINATSSSHSVGDPLDLFPEYGFTVSAQHDFKWNNTPGFARLDYGKHGRMSYRNRSIGPWYSDESDIIDMLNFHMGLRWNDSLSLGFFAQNLLNDRGFTSSGSIEQNAPRPRPRTFGIGFGVRF